MKTYDPYDDTRPHLSIVGGTDFEAKKLGVSALNRGVLFSRILPGNHPQENTRLLEASFVEVWVMKNERCLLEQILATDRSDPSYDKIPKTEREWAVAHMVAASLIQWLPTAVGCSFLHEAFGKGGGTFKYTLPSIDKKLG